jgi:hypothetical protein
MSGYGLWPANLWPQRYIETERMAALIAWMPVVRVGNLVNTNRVLSMRSRPLSGPFLKAKKDPGSDAGVLSYASTTETLAD